MSALFFSVLPTLVLAGLFVVVVYLIKYIASRFWNFK